MATEAQVSANRSNARKSTGPRTAEGKATVAQNAVKHGFSGRLDVIKGEEQAEFDLHRQSLLEELAPAGAMETMLAERIAGLSWRLKRAERMENEAFEALLTPDTASLAVRLAQSLRPKRSESEEEVENELAFGRAVVKDFGHGRVLDRLFMYGRRMEHSLYRTMAELQRLRLVHDLDGPAESVRSVPVRASKETPDGVTTNEVGRGCPTLDEVEGRLYEERADRVSSLKLQVASEENPRPTLQTSQFKPQTAAEAAAGDSCKTKPICPSPEQGQVPDSKEVKENLPENERGETKPISPAEMAAAGFDPLAKN